VDSGGGSVKCSQDWNQFFFGDLRLKRLFMGMMDMGASNLVPTEQFQFATRIPPEALNQL